MHSGDWHIRWNVVYRIRHGQLASWFMFFLCFFFFSLLFLFTKKGFCEDSRLNYIVANHEKCIASHIWFWYGHSWHKPQWCNTGSF